MEVRIKAFHQVKKEGSTAVAMLDISLDGVITIRGCKIVRGDKGLFISMPRVQRGEQWENVVTIEDLELEQLIEDKVMSYAGKNLVV
jgi:DNA-binding cell septation regulator SpoVG